MASAQAAGPGPRGWQPSDGRDLEGSRPLILYFDGSALAKLFLREPGSEHATTMWGVGEPTTSSVVGYSEVRSAIAAAERSLRVSWRRGAEAVEELDAAWPIVCTIALDDSLSLYAGALAARHGLRALDAVHLASALSLSDGQPVMVSWDDELRRAAEAEGLAISPA